MYVSEAVTEASTDEEQGEKIQDATKRKGEGLLCSCLAGQQGTSIKAALSTEGSNHGYVT